MGLGVAMPLLCTWESSGLKYLSCKVANYQVIDPVPGPYIIPESTRFSAYSFCRAVEQQ